MEIRDEKVNGFTVVRIKGKLDASNSNVLEEKLVSIIDKNDENILINLRELDYISSSGLRVLLFTAKKMKELKGKFVLCELVPHIKDIFEIAGFTAIFTIYSTEQEALAVK